MECDQCGTQIPVRKSLKRGKSARPDECPDCGHELEKGQSVEGDLIQK